MTTAHRALVTGAATGLGLATALALGRLGYDLAVTAMAGETLEELTSHPDLHGRRIVVIPLELRSESSIRDAAAFVPLPTSDRRTYRALKNALSEIGEAVKLLPPEIAARHPGVDWRGWAGLLMRNRRHFR